MELWQVDLPQSLRSLEARERIAWVVTRAADFHAQTGYGEDGPTLIGPPAEDEDVGELEKQLGCRLPAEYRLFLSECRFLHFLDGFSVSGLTENGQLQPWIDQDLLDGRTLLCCGEALWDNVYLDLGGDQPHHVFLWQHDFRELHKLGSSFSLALARISWYLWPDDRWDEAVRGVRADIEYRRQPWWRRWFMPRPRAGVS